MKYCKDYFGIACEHCPVLLEGEEVRMVICGKCLYYRGCSVCVAWRYGVCPEGKVEAEGGEKNE